MSIPREVILDLVPLYLAGEASPETRALIEARLAEDPELATRVRAIAAEEAAASGAGAATRVAPPPELELQALRRVRSRLRWQRWLFAIGVACIAVLFSLRISFEAGLPSRIDFFLLTEAPAVAALVAVVGAAAWWAYFGLGRARRR